MIKNKSEETNVQNDCFNEGVCNFNYLSELMNGKKHLITEVMDVFLKQVPDELQNINKAVAEMDYAKIKIFAHSMRSTVSIMGITILGVLLKEMEDLSFAAAADATQLTPGNEKIKEMNRRLNLICRQAIAETEKEICNYK
jgi:HPt (histidine-containing phosphotransfer) domain-containing protein